MTLLRRAWGWVRAGGFRLLLAVVGVVVVGLLGRSLGWERIAGRVKQIGPGFAWVLAAYLVVNLLYALPLGFVLPSCPPLRSLLASRFAAVSVNSATPFLGLGGEPVRLLWLPAPERKPGVAALVIDRSAFLGASALFLAVGVGVASARLRLPPSLKVALPVVAAVTVALAFTLYLRQRGRGVAGPVARLFGLFSRRHRRRMSEGAGEIDRHVRLLHDHRPARFPVAVAVHLAGRFASIVEVAVAARLLGLGLSTSGALLFASLPLAVDLAFSVVPSQIGVHEGSSALLASALGLDPAAGVALAFVQRMRQLVFVSLGFALLATRRRRDSRANMTQGELWSSRPRKSPSSR